MGSFFVAVCNYATLGKGLQVGKILSAVDPATGRFSAKEYCTTAQVNTKECLAAKWFTQAPKKKRRGARGASVPVQPLGTDMIDTFSVVAYFPGLTQKGGKLPARVVRSVDERALDWGGGDEAEGDSSSS